MLTTARILAATLLTSALAGVGAVTLVAGPPAYAAPEPSCTDVGVPTQTRQAQAVFTGTPPAVAGVVYGGAPIADMEAQGALTVEGDRELAARFTTLFPLPPRASRPGATS